MWRRLKRGAVMKPNPNLGSVNQLEAAEMCDSRLVHFSRHTAQLKQSTGRTAVDCALHKSGLLYEEDKKKGTQSRLNAHLQLFATLWSIFAVSTIDHILRLMCTLCHGRRDVLCSHLAQMKRRIH